MKKIIISVFAFLSLIGIAACDLKVEHTYPDQTKQSHD